MVAVKRFEWSINPDALFREPHAYALVEALIRLSNFWDDLIDRDKSVGDNEINDCFWIMFSDLRRNPFYRLHEATLQPLIESAMLGYHCANHWEETADEHGIELGHFLRYAITQVIAHIVFLNVGLREARAVLPDLYKGLCNDRLDNYRREVRAKHDV